jgi:hypothetical protein
LQQQIDAKLPTTITAWRGWQLDVPVDEQLEWLSFFAEAPGNTGAFRTVVGAKASGLKLHRTVKQSASERWLVIDAVKTRSSPVKINIRVNERARSEFELPLYDKNQNEIRPAVVRLSDPSSEKAECTIEIRQESTSEPNPVLWRGISLAAQHPLLWRVFEDETGSAAVDEQMKYHGQRSVRLGRGGLVDFPCGSPLAIRERPQLGEYRFVRFVVRKRGGGGMRVTLEPDSGPSEKAIYEAGANLPADPAVKRLSTAALKDEWLVITRDLFGDFGGREISGMRFECPDGEALWIDHVYLARTQRDFELISTVSPDPARN